MAIDDNGGPKGRIGRVRREALRLRAQLQTRMEETKKLLNERPDLKDHQRQRLLRFLAEGRQLLENMDRDLGQDLK